MVSRQMKIELARIVRGGGMDGEVAPYPADRRVGVSFGPAEIV